MIRPSEYTINVHGRLIDLGRPQVMGILNVTPDSFYAGSRRRTEYEIAERANRIIAEGGTIIDVGAFSTRPGAPQVSEEEERTRLRRGLEVVRREQPDAVVSVDTFRPAVARMAVEEYGAGIINDVSEGNVNGAFGGPDASNPHSGTTADDLRAADERTPAGGNTDGETADCKSATAGRRPADLQSAGNVSAGVPEMFRMVARLGVPYILMSVKPTVESMMLSFAREVQQLRDLGAKDIILDPGFGFGKTLGQNYAILGAMERLLEFGLPLLAGVSRKSMIWRLLGGGPDDALNGTTVLNTMALERGASILRVHDVREAVEAVKMAEEVRVYNV